MLCGRCDEIVLLLDGSDAKVELRNYRNIYDIQSTAAKCDFCALVYEEVRELERPNTAPYCKQKWDMDFFCQLLDASRIHVHHPTLTGEHYVLMDSLLDAESAADYTGGPIGLRWEPMLGGIYTHTGGSSSRQL